MDLDTKIAQARAAGASWDQINGAIGQRVNAAKQAGATDAQIQAAFGQNVDPAHVQGVMAHVQTNVQQNLDAHPEAQQNVVSDPMGAFKAGLQASSGGLIARGKLPDTVLAEHVGMFTRLAREAGEFTGDLPAMFTGAVAGGAAGGAAGGGAGAAVPVVGETGVSEAVGGVGGAVVGGGAGSTALPEFIKSAYIDGLKHGLWKDPQDFAARTGNILWNTTKAGAVGAATSFVGGKVTQGFAKAGTAINPWAQLGVKTTAELATMTTVSAGLEGRLPTKEDVIDGAALLAFFHVAGGGGAAIRSKMLSNGKSNLADHWAETEQSPVAAAQQAAQDPILRTKLQSPPQPAVHPIASKVSTPSGDYVVQHIPTSFDDEVKFMMTTQEGGGHLVTDTGGVTKWGLSKKANPDLDIPNLTQIQAQQIYHDRYWKPINADAIQDPKLRLAAFDAAVNQGVGQTKAWLQESGGNLKTFLALRAQQYAKLIANDPDKYGKYEGAWNQRMKNLGAAGTIKEMAPGAAEGGEGAPPAEPPEPPAPPPPPEWEKDPWGSIRGTMGEFDPQAKPSLRDAVSDTAYKIYREMFNPSHPINKIVDAAEQGTPLTDAGNPKFLYRLAEMSNTRSQYMIERNMIDHEGNVTGPGLKDILPPKADHEDFMVYAKARWASEKADQAKETGVEAGAARQVVAEGKDRVSGDRTFEDRFKQLVGWQNGTLKYLHDTGVLSKEGYETSLAENTARIPGYRIHEDDASSAGGAGAGKTAFNPVKKFLGSDKKTQPILESLMKEAFLRVELGNRNAANAALAAVAEPLGLAHQEPTPPTKITLTDDELLRAGADPGAIDEDGEGMAIYRRLSKGLTADQVPILADGKMQAWKFDDPEVTRYLRGYDKISLSTWQKMAASVTDVTRKLIVMNPLFPVRLMQYDVPWQFITKPGFRNTLANTVVGLRHVAGNTDVYDAWLRSGGAEKVFDGLSRDAYIQDVLKGQEDPSFLDGAWNALNTPYHGLRAWGQLLNQSQRVGRFAEGLNDGESQLRAGVASSDAAFHRAGFGGPGAKVINAVSPFFNAYLNSMEQTVRSQFGIGKTITGEDFNPGQFAAKAAAVITLPLLANWYLSKDKEWYKAAPDWQKDNGLLLHVGADDGGHTLFLKYPALISLLYGGIPRRIMDRFLNDNPDAFDGMGASFGSALLPGGGLISYNVFLPIIEHIANHSFFKDHPLVPGDIQRAAMAPEQYNNYSSDTAKQLSRWVNDLPLLRSFKLAPPDIDNYIQGWGGTLGEGAVKAAELAYHSAKGDRASPTLEDWPLINSFLARYPSASAQPIIDFEGKMDQFNQVHGSLSKTLQAGDLDRFKEIAGGNPTAAVMHAYKFRNEPVPDNTQPYAQALQSAQGGADTVAAQNILMADKALTNARMYVKFVNANPTLSPRDKRQMTDQAYGQMQVMAERGLEAFKNMERGKPSTPDQRPTGMRPPVGPQAENTAPPPQVPLPGGNRGDVPIA